MNWYKNMDVETRKQIETLMMRLEQMKREINRLDEELSNYKKRLDKHKQDMLDSFFD